VRSNRVSYSIPNLRSPLLQIRHLTEKSLFACGCGCRFSEARVVKRIVTVTKRGYYSRGSDGRIRRRNVRTGMEIGEGVPGGCVDKSKSRTCVKCIGRIGRRTELKPDYSQRVSGTELKDGRGLLRGERLICSRACQLSLSGRRDSAWVNYDTLTMPSHAEQTTEIRVQSLFAWDISVDHDLFGSLVGDYVIT